MLLDYASVTATHCLTFINISYTRRLILYSRPLLFLIVIFVHPASSSCA